MELIYGRPFQGAMLEALKAFLLADGLRYDEGVEFTVCVMDGDKIAATGSLDGKICKCIAVSPAYQGEGLSATVLTALRKEAFDRSQRHLFLYTKPKNRWMFEDLGFFAVAETADTLLMENKRRGLSDFLAAQTQPETPGVVGAVVANCNPFTLGHRYLMEEAAKQCDTLHVFILSEDKSTVPAADRLRLAREGLADLSNVLVHPGGDYLISSATFPTYFLKDQAKGAEVFCQLDLELFATRFAPHFGITKRFVGTEPLCQVTNAYNEAMLSFLPKHGIEVVQLARKEQDDAPISASRVRALWKAGDFAALAPLVPETTLAYLKEKVYPIDK